MSALSNKSFSQYRCVEAALPFSAVAQRLLVGGISVEKRIRIPNTELSLYPIGLGTVDAGLKWDGPEADRIFGTYLEQGGNVIDTEIGRAHV